MSAMSGEIGSREAAKRNQVVVAHTVSVAHEPVTARPYAVGTSRATDSLPFELQS